MATTLTPPQTILLAVHHASTSNIPALQLLTPTRLHVLPPELLLRILLTYLPESTDPRDYASYLSDLTSPDPSNSAQQQVTDNADTTPIQGLSEKETHRRAKRALKGLLHLTAATYPSNAPQDPLTRFLYHRAHRIDEQTGLLNLLPALVGPFLERNEWLRTWYVSVVLPLVRLELEYYPAAGNERAKDAVGEERESLGLRELERLEGRQGVEVLLRRAEEGDRGGQDGGTDGEPSQENGEARIARDVRGLVGPWMYGQTLRKRRKLSQPSSPPATAQPTGSGYESSIPTAAHPWHHLYTHLTHLARTRLPLTHACIHSWDGPTDLDLGPLNPSARPADHLDEATQRTLETQYAQTAFAACYAAAYPTPATLRVAHGIVARVGELLDLAPPSPLPLSATPAVATETGAADALPPRVEAAVPSSLRNPSRWTALAPSDLDPAALLRPDHPLTTPGSETYALLKVLVCSAQQLGALGHGVSVAEVARLRFCAEGRREQRGVLGKVVRGLVMKGRGEERGWVEGRGRLVWLWGWGWEDEGADAEVGGSGEAEGKGQGEGAGVLGGVERVVLEEEVLGGMLETGCYDLATRTYITDDQAAKRLPRATVERVVLGKAMESYDAASNGNRTRGGVKKASDIITAFRPHFKDSAGFSQASSLIAATHSLSFYSLTLQHGVPFQPVSIRVSSDPISLIDKVLEQNARSYTQLDDLIGIAVHLSSAGLPHPSDSAAQSSSVDPEDDGDDENDENDSEAKRKKDADRRVTFMAVQAALREDDFETAYSYIVNRLTPSGTDITAPKTPQYIRQHSRPASASATDDISWRAAFLAGRYRGSSTSTSTSTSTTSSGLGLGTTTTTTTPPPSPLRRLEQRTELLALALLLAPTPNLNEILGVWRRCEEETTSLQASLQAAEDELDDRADKRMAGAGGAAAGSSAAAGGALPGGFVVGGEQPALVLGQGRREMGRFGGGGGGGGGRGKREDAAEAPVSMFDLTRSAARAFSRNAFPLQGGGDKATGEAAAAGPARAKAGVMGGSDGGGEGLEGSTGSLRSRPGDDGDGEDEQQRVRRRDMVANAATGALASGLGWVLGATPVEQQRDGKGRGAQE